MASVSKNSVYLITGSVIQKILAFIYFIILARFLGPDQVGKYTFAIYFTAIFAVFIDWGLNQVLIRETAREQTKAKDYFYNMLTVKIFFSAVIYFIVFLLVNLLHYPAVTRSLVYLAALVTALDSITNLTYSFIRGFQNLKYESIGLSTYQFIVLVFGSIFLCFHFPLPWIIVPLLLASIFNLSYSLIILFNKYHVPILCRFNWPLIKEMARVTIPFFLSGVFGTVFSYIDVVLLSKLAGDQFVGFYSAAGKMPAGLRLVPIAFAAALYPAASFYFINNKEELKKIVEKSISYLILFCLPAVLGLWVLADKAMNIMYGHKFTAAIPALRIIVWSVIFVFLDYIFFALLNACGKEKQNVYNRGIAMIVIISLNLILIPVLKQMGSAISFTLSYGVLALMGGWFSWKIIKFSVKNILTYFFKVLLVSLVMSVVIIFLKPIIPLVFVILIGALIYLFGLWMTGLLGRSDVEYLRGLVGVNKSN